MHDFLFDLSTVPSAAIPVHNFQIEQNAVLHNQVVTKAATSSDRIRQAVKSNPMAVMAKGLGLKSPALFGFGQTLVDAAFTTLSPPEANNRL